MSIYSKGLVNLTINDDEIKNIALVDIQGKELFSKNVANLTTINLDLQHLPNGIYYLRLHRTDGFNLEKVILAR